MLKKGDKQSSLAEDGRAANRAGRVEVVRFGGLGWGVDLEKEARGRLCQRA